MNHRFYCVNVSNSNVKRKESGLSSDFIQEKELKEIYNTQYNDLFPKILSKTKSEFISLLKEQVYLHLKIINKKIRNSLNLNYLESFTKKYNGDKNKATKGLEDLNKNSSFQEKYLSKINCFIHCHKCSNILHKCKNRIILYKNFIYCLSCQKVYNENQIKLYCSECKTCYYSKLRYIPSKKLENFYPVSFKDYHCNIEEEEKIKCLECGQDLYYNINYEKKNNRKNSISEVFCIKCKLLYDLKEIYFKCKVCDSDFKSEAIIYSSFSHLKVEFLLIMHTLRKKKLAIPQLNINRKCKCDISKYNKYLHQDDNGILYLGNNLEGQYVIICDKCYSIFIYNEFLWSCPLCGINFKSKKIIIKTKYERGIIGKEKIKNEKTERSEDNFKSPSNNLERKKYIEKYPTSAGFIKKNSDNIIKNLFKRNNTEFNDSNFKNNHKTRVIFLTNNNDNEKKPNLNLSDKKENISKRIKKGNNYKNIFYNSVNFNFREIDLKKPYFINKNNINNNTVNSLLNYISLSNNRMESNTNKCTDSTSNITYRNYDGISEKYIDLNCKAYRYLSYFFDSEINPKISIDNNKTNGNLKYEDFIENDKEKKVKNYAKKNISRIKKEINEKNKESENQISKRKESRDSFIKNKEKQNITNSKKEKLNNTEKKMKDNIKFIVNQKVNKNHENVEVKKISLTNLNNKLKDKDRFLFESLDNVKIIKTDLNSINNNNINNYSLSKVKNIKSLKNIDAKKINNNNKSRKRIKNIKSVKSVCENNIKLNINKTDKTNNNINNKNKEEEIKLIDKKEKGRNSYENIGKRPASKQIFKFNSQNEVILKSRNYKNNNKNNDLKNLYKNSIFDRIKEYYDNYKKEKDDLLKDTPNFMLRRNNQCKTDIKDAKGKINFKIDFKSDNYSILRLLGRGTYGKTYLVEDPKTKERYALKKININDKIELKENQDEYNLILKLTKAHPNLKIINIYGIELKNLDKFNTVMYVLMEAANCDWEKELINRCKNNAFYKESQLMLILAELIKTFSILQKNGISHRDVKPQNILCFGEKGYKISDFGEAKNFKKNFVDKNIKKDYYEDNTMKQTLRGTELYMSPILFHALRTRPYQLVKYNPFKSDVFSLGMCFFLASSLNYEGLYEVREIINNPIKTKLVVNKYLNNKYSQKYINLLISMLQIDEKNRPDFIELEKIMAKINN